MNLKASFNNCLLVFVTMNLLQSYFSPILQDEALYWNFAQHLDWGYFDHPPMVALLVKIGGLFFSKTLGVRLMTVLLMGVLVKIIWNFIPLHQRKNKHAPLLYFGILFSIPACNVYSFVTTPDVPLLFFSGLYLLAFLKFTKKNNTKHLLFLGIAAALLLYSKYHGALVIFLTVLCHPKLLKKRSTYLAGLVALLLLLPHLYWQYKHDFISVQYHLFERSKVGFESSNVLGAFFGFVGILNPGFVILLATSLRKNRRIYKKDFSLMFRLFIGYLTFFLLYSFRSRPEAHWVAFAMIPMAVLLFNLANSNAKARKKIQHIALVSSLLLFSARLLIAFQIPIASEFQKEKNTFFEAISKLAGDRKVVFLNSYQRASKFNYYTNKQAVSVNTAKSRQNQFDLWAFESESHNKPILLVKKKGAPLFDSIQTSSGAWIFYREIEHFPRFNATIGRLKNKTPLVFYRDKPGTTNISIQNPTSFVLDFQRKDFPYTLSFLLTKNKTHYKIPLDYKNPNKILEKTTEELSVSWNLKKEKIPKGDYALHLLLGSKNLYDQKISKSVSVQIQ